MRLRRLIVRLRTSTSAFAHDLVMIPLAWLGAFWLRFNLEAIPQTYASAAFSMLPIVILVQCPVLYYFGLYRGVWRFASLPDLVRIIKASLVGVALVAVAAALYTRLQGIPRSVFPLDAILLVALLAGPRLVYRLIKDRHFPVGTVQRVLIVGAGRAGELLVRDLLRERQHSYFPVGFVDDDAAKKGREIHGVRVLDYTKRIARVARERDVDLLLLAIPSASAREMRRIVELCEGTGLPMRTLPRLQDLVSGRATVSALREIHIEDLLGRDPVEIDWTDVNRLVSGKRILVTGGAGSIGSELSRQVARLAPASLIVLDRSEFGLYRIERELRRTAPDASHQVELADVCDDAALERVFEVHKPDIVFHAAAFKHVPMLEGRAREALRNNVLGTAAVARKAGAHRCEAFVLISTDKAVNPTNVMGASKRAAEIVCQSLQHSNTATRFLTVRFGNVLDSAGSVVPLFREQIAAGGPVTITHPEITRFFMTIPEACQLILEAAVLGRGGEIFVLEMGEAVSIVYLAEQMIRLAGLVPGQDIEIRCIGLRPGEKLHEELFYDHEERVTTEHRKLQRARSADRDWEVVEATLRRLESAVASYDEPGCVGLLRELVPELAPERRGAAARNVIPFDKAMK